MLKDVIIANKIYAKLNLSNEQPLDEIAVKVIRQDTPDFVLPFKMVDIDGETELRYEIGDGMRLNYLPDNMTKSELLILLENMLRPFKECNDWLLDYHNFHLDKNYIIVGKDYLNVKYIYIPVANYAKTDAELLEFVEDVVWNITLKDEPMYVMNLCRRLKDKQTTLFSFLEYISQELGGNAKQIKQEASFLDEFGLNGSSKNQQSKPAPAEPVAPTPKPYVSDTPASSGSEFGKEDLQGKLIENLFDDSGVPAARESKNDKKPEHVKDPKDVKDRKGFLNGLFGSGKNADKGKKKDSDAACELYEPRQSNENAASYHAEPQQTPSYEAPANSFNSNLNATQIFSMDELAGIGNKLMLHLEEDGGYPFPKVIELDFSSRNHVVIGRYDKSGTPQADYNFEASFSFISRRHLRVEKNGDQFVVVDLNSGNGSMVNGDVLVPNMPYGVQAGDRIIFSKAHRISYRVR